MTCFCISVKERKKQDVYLQMQVERALIPSITFRILSSGCVYEALCVLFAQAVLPHSECRVSVCCVNVVPGRDAWPRTVASAFPFV